MTTRQASPPIDLPARAATTGAASPATAGWIARYPALPVLVLLLIAYELLYGRFFPNPQGRLGADYSYVLPDLLAGDYWFHQNGAFSIPWFTPAFCAGRPYYADPQSAWFALSQWLSFLVDPVKAIHVSLLVFAGLGFVGLYRLARDLFRAGRPAALLAAAVFMFNGFYAFRMIVGHAGFHGFMLAPLLAWLIAAPGGDPRQRAWSARDSRYAAASALLVGYLICSGLGTLLVPTVLAVALLLVWAVLRADLRIGPRLAGRALAGVLAGLLIGASHLSAALALMGNFPRTGYLLPGFASFYDSLLFAFQALFLAPADVAEQAGAALVNVQWAMERHELEYGVGLVPLLAVLASAVLAWQQRAQPAPARSGTALSGTAARRAWWALLVLLILLPVVLNTYQEDWNALLKQLPLIGASSTLIRWYLMLVPFAALLCLSPFERLERGRHVRVATAGMLLLLGGLAWKDTSSYQSQPYLPKDISAAYQQLSQGGLVPTIVTLGLPRNPAAQARPNDSLAAGVSDLACYYPTFGYRLENFPVGDLVANARVDQVLGGDHFNLKNPACYVYPAENGCTPGADFTLAQRTEAARFTRYQAWNFAVPVRQQLADTFSLAGLVSALAALLLPPLLGRWRPRRP